MNATVIAVLAAVLLGAAAPAASGAPVRMYGIGIAVARQATPQTAAPDSSADVDSVPETWTAPAPFAVPPIEPFEGTVVRRSSPWVTAVVILLAAVVLVLAGALAYRRLSTRRYWREEADEALAPLVFNRPARRPDAPVQRPAAGNRPVTALDAGMPAGADRAAAPAPAAPPARAPAAPPGPAPTADAPPRTVAPTADARPGSGAQDRPGARPVSVVDDVTKGKASGYNEKDADVPIAESEPPGIEIEAGPIRFHRPPAGTLQLLPGRLEIVSGNERQEEIRFVKLPRAAAVVTFGRVPGAAYRHIQLQSPTVSRMHAAMQFQGGRWHIENLSHTNPVIVNGRRMAVNGAAEMLSEGDQVEMGEVVFRFRAR